MAATRLSIRIDLASGDRIGPGKIALLEAIRSTGSISAAARALGMSYRRAWLLVEEVNDALLEPAVTAEIGGRRGGGAALTAVGERVVDLYRSIESHARSAAGGEFRAIGKLVRQDKAPAWRMERQMKLSARNLLKGTIVDVKKGQTTAHVRIDVGGSVVTASITNEAVDELKLQKGQQAYAVIKASDVMVAID
jgi:molybdate transport system regulatory protein